MVDVQETLHFLDYWRVIRSRKEIVMAVFLLTVLCGIIITQKMDDMYMSSVIIQVTNKKESSDLNVFRSSARYYDPLFLRTQFEIIQSRPVVEEIVNRLDLVERLFGEDQMPLEVKKENAIKIIMGHMDVEQFRDTNLIQIKVYMDMPVGEARTIAAEIANTAADVYQRQMAERNRVTMSGALSALKESLTVAETDLKKANDRVESVRKEFNIVVRAARGTEYDALDKIGMASLENMRVEAQMEMAHKKAILEEIKKYSGDDLLDVFPHVVGDTTLLRMRADKRKAEIERMQLKESYSAKHPKVLRIEAVVMELDRTIADALEGLKRGVEVGYDAAKAKYDIVIAELDKVKKREIKAAGMGYREFNKALADRDDARNMRNALEVRYMEELIVQRMPKTLMEVITPAKASLESDRIRPDLKLNIIISIVVGLVAGVGLAYFVEYLDTSVKTIDEIENILGLTAMGVIPQKVKPLIDPSAELAHAEPYRVLRTSLQFSDKLPKKSAICVTSGSVGEGKSLTLFNLAYVCAQLGDRTVLVDADMHRPKQHKMFNLSNEKGLANILIGDIELSDAMIDTGVANLDFLPSGKLATGVHGLLDTGRMKMLVQELKDKYDRVFFDAPPIIGVSDASLLVREMDGVMMVIQHRKYPTAVSIRARSMLENLGVNVVGVVLNNINVSKDYSYYYYHHHYTSYREGGKRGKRGKKS